MDPSRFDFQGSSQETEDVTNSAISGYRAVMPAINYVTQMTPTISARFVQKTVPECATRTTRVQVNAVTKASATARDMWVNGSLVAAIIRAI